VRRGPALRRSKALPYRSAMPPEGRRGNRNPQGPSGPTRFRNGIPRLWQSFHSGPRRLRTCNLPIKSRVLRRLSYGAVQRGRQESNLRAPRFKRALYRAELRPRVMSEAGVEPATSCL
jgi:hypothetical protein